MSVQLTVANIAARHVITEALKNNTLQPYTIEMSGAARELIAGVELDSHN